MGWGEGVVQGALQRCVGTYRGSAGKSGGVVGEDKSRRDRMGWVELEGKDGPLHRLHL